MILFDYLFSLNAIESAATIMACLLILVVEWNKPN